MYTITGPDSRMFIPAAKKKPLPAPSQKKKGQEHGKIKKGSSGPNPGEITKKTMITLITDEDNVIRTTTDATDALIVEERSMGMRAQRIHCKKSGRKNLQFTSPGYSGWCAPRNNFRARVWA